jgi:Competence protein CoiA-like family
MTGHVGNNCFPPVHGKIQIPYGRDGAGRIRHISEVSSGLISGCVCPACGTPLVAYKGKLKRHHFGHHADRACSGALETALHEFAKQVLADSRMLWLPPLIARHEQAEKRIRPAREFSYDAVDVERA